VCPVINRKRDAPITINREIDERKGEVMKKLNKVALLMLAAVFGAALAIAPAQAQSTRVSVDIPFDFEVGKATMKAGTYRVEKQGSFVSLTNANGQTGYAMLLPGDGAVKHNEAYLVFTRFEGVSFLHRIVFSVDNNYELPRSNRQKELMSKTTSGQQVALAIRPVL
jgi:hypothetical protein